MSDTTVLDIGAAKEKISREFDCLESVLKHMLELIKCKEKKLYRRADILDYEVKRLFNNIARITFLFELLEDKEMDN